MIALCEQDASRQKLAELIKIIVVVPVFRVVVVIIEIDVRIIVEQIMRAGAEHGVTELLAMPLHDRDCFERTIDDVRFDALFAQTSMEEFLHGRQFAAVPLELDPEMTTAHDNYEIRASESRSRSFMRFVPDSRRQKVFALQKLRKLGLLADFSRSFGRREPKTVAISRRHARLH